MIQCVSTLFGEQLNPSKDSERCYSEKLIHSISFYGYPPPPVKRLRVTYIFYP